jgi:dUTP pyrophosphatase
LGRLADLFHRRVLHKKVRGFEVVEDWARMCPEADIKLPTRSTQDSAAYDIYSTQEVTIRPGEKIAIPTDIKVYMKKDEVFHLYPRSNQGIKFDIMLANTTGVIDSDYYGNPDNDGNFTIVLRNLGATTYVIKNGDRIAQGEFARYLKADHDYNKKLKKRTGGVGSTGR